MNLISTAVILVSSFPFIFMFSFPHDSTGKASVLYTFIPVCFLTFEVLKIVAKGCKILKS
jgi:hypothetical protein